MWMDFQDSFYIHFPLPSAALSNLSNKNSHPLGNIEFLTHVIQNLIFSVGSGQGSSFGNLKDIKKWKGDEMSRLRSAARKN